MKRIFLFLSLSAFAATAMAQELTCEIQVNGASRLSAPVTISEKGRQKYAEFEGYAFYVSSLGAGRYEVEVFDASVPSRSYAEGRLLSAEDRIAWTLWSREILLESSCRLTQRRRSS